MSFPNSISPIFVLGAHRSGTTWLANGLCNHDEIWGIQSDMHQGIVESWFFSHLDGRFGDISLTVNFDQFLNAFCQTAFFVTSGLTREQVQEISPLNYGDFLNQFMIHALAINQPGRFPKYWLEKTPVHTLYFEKLVIYYPEAKIIVVSRALESVVHSTCRLLVDLGLISSRYQLIRTIIMSVFHWHKYGKYTQEMKRKYPQCVLEITYEDLIGQPEFFYGRCLDFLNLNWSSQVLKERFSPNTSYRTKPRKKMDNISEIMIDLARAFVSKIPFQFYKMEERLRKPRNQTTIPFCINSS